MMHNNVSQYVTDKLQYASSHKRMKGTMELTSCQTLRQVWGVE